MAFQAGQNYVDYNAQMGGYVAVVNGNITGPFATQGEAERKFNELMATGGGGAVGPAGAGNLFFGAGDYQTYLYDQLALEYSQLAYQQSYLNTYLIPQMQMVDKRERARLALDATTQYAQLFGFGLPQNFLAIMKYGMGGEMNAGGMGDLIPASANVSDEEMANIRVQLESAGWQGGTDDQAVDAFLKTVAPGTQDEFVQKVQTSLLPTGAKPTIEGAAALAAPYGQADVMKLLGTTEAQMAGAPGYQYQGQPTLAMRQIQATPQQVPQSLMLQSMTPQQAGGFLSMTPTVQQLTAGRTPMSGQAAPFSFISGRSLSAQDVGQWSPSKMGLVTGLTQFSGQRPEDFWAEFARFRPQGAAMAPTRIG